MKTVVAGMMAGVPGQAGASWAVLQYVLGLRQLGHQTTFVEEVAPGSLRPAGAPIAATSAGQYLARLTEQFGLHGRAGMFCCGTRDATGMSYEEILAACTDADLLLNISGVLRDPGLLEACRHRVYLDLDPAFTQIWDLQGHDVGLGGHDRFATVGLAIGASSCPVPGGNRRWIPTLPPVVLKHWEAAEPAPAGAFTTVGNWRGYGSVEHDGAMYGQKAHSIRRLIDLPVRTEEQLLLALSIHPAETADLQALSANGWRLADSKEVSSTPRRYRDFIGRSKAEFSPAKSGYADSRCGWFSDRTACYLAAGRPAVVEETGAQDFVPAGEGLITFRDTGSAADALGEVSANYQRHCKAARGFAEDLLNSDRVLSLLLEKVS